ncbi:hypothetical protein [Anaerobaca lacustris]|uniref:Tetratricopeptide repeat protein n=1 Tax=Anaerobaca lacustris TaxID=3044600 RepID=A0AAW6TXM2_9BACT|nr:hypothetical protein [Sedimentisphaerales bacterium M17dextr]
MLNTRIKPHATMTDIVELLDRGEAEKALASIAHCGQDSPPWRNARGVCLLRLGRYDEAVRTFRELVFPGGRIVVAEDVPPLHVANFITAMLLKRNLEAAIPLLEHLHEDGNPYVRQLLQATRQWRRSLTWVQRLRCYIGWYPGKPFPLDFPPGGL